MELEVHLIQTDYKALMLFLTKRERHGGYKSYLTPLLIGLMLGAVLAVNQKMGLVPMDWASAAIGFLIAFILSFLGFLKVNLELQKRQIPNADSPVIGPHRIRLSDEGVRSTSAELDLFVRWGGIRSLEESSRHFFLMIDNNRNLIMPKRSFSNDGECSAFENMVRRNLGPKQQ